MRIAIIALAFLLGLAGRASANDEAAIRDVLARWYAELARAEDGRPYALTAPGFINASPWYHYADNCRSARLGPPVYTSLAATALKFAYDIVAARADDGFARVDVWERGYFYAWATQQTYELAASATFVLEKQPDGQWQVLAQRSDRAGIPPNRITDPMPDLRGLYLQTRPETPRP